ncbi:MAG: TRAP transporter small permease [Desulfobacterales bacterium]|nr:TRAP transporter small permease [Desulfobacterales bacterium]MCP4163691.1 TRAP transporter small permease [Deltaproteobacteria bacterium]
MERFDSILDFLEKWTKTAGAICLVGMASVTLCDIVLRYFGKPIFGSEEIVMFLATLVVAFTLPFAHTQKSHIGVEILVRLFSERTKRIIYFITDIVTVLFFTLVAWRVFLYAGKEKKAGTVSLNLEFPEYYIIYALSFCFMIFVMFVVKDLFVFVKGEK